MRHHVSAAPSVVVYVNGAGSYADHGTGPVGHLHSPLAGAEPARYDPAQVHRDFPDRWSAYIRSSFRDFQHVMQVFNVSERTARKWMAGETGAVGGHVAIAILEHPVDAPRMLFAAE